MGLTATFSVNASGTELQYQWSKNGVAIPGATSGSYTTPATAFSDSGTQYAVTISNSLGSVTSNSAGLNVTARAPLAGDLRFQQVASATTVSGYNNSGGIGYTLSGGAYLATQSIGTPLILAAGNSCGPPGTILFVYCPVSFAAFTLPIDLASLGLSTGYADGVRQDVQPDLQNKNWPTPPSGNPASPSGGSPALPNAIVTSLLLDGGQFDVSWIQTAQPGTYSVNQQIISPGALSDAATQEGARGRVITAVSYFDDTHVIYLSYGWSGDPDTVYETTVQPATLETAPTVAASIAQQGYIITAMGGSLYTDSLFLVGTRVQGDTMPRPFMTASSAADQIALFQKGYAVVGRIDNITTAIPVVLGER
jgi:hypothetical protein